MSGKILELNEPLFRHSPANTFLLSVIGSDKKEFAWIMNNFVNLRINPFTRFDDFYRMDMWYNCPYVTDNILSRDLIKSFSGNGIAELFIDLINNGYYIYIPEMSREKIAAYNITQGTNAHNFLIYGYDDVKRVFYIMDFFRQELKCLQGTFDEIEKAYCVSESVSPKIQESTSFLGLHIFKKRELSEIGFTDKEKLLVQIQDYILAKNKYSDCFYPFSTNDVEFAVIRDNPNAMKYQFGLNFYDVLIDLLIKDTFLVRPFQLLYIHKQLMALRLSFWEKQGRKVDEKLIKQCQELMQLTFVTRNLYFKYWQKGFLDINTIGKIIDNLKVLQEKDFIFMTKMYSFCSI